MKLSHSADVLPLPQKSPRTSLSSSLNAAIFAAACLLCAGALASAQTVSTVYNFKGGSTSMFFLLSTRSRS